MFTTLVPNDNKAPAYIFYGPKRISPNVRFRSPSANYINPNTGSRSNIPWEILKLTIVLSQSQKKCKSYLWLLFWFLKPICLATASIIRTSLLTILTAWELKKIEHWSSDHHFQRQRVFARLSALQLFVWWGHKLTNVCKFSHVCCAISSLA